jgi:hypothetical protein
MKAVGGGRPIRSIDGSMRPLSCAMVTPSVITASVLKAVEFVNGEIADAVMGLDAADQETSIKP